HQVKIRGFRIEMGEIEARLLNHKMIKEVVVLDRRTQDGEIYLCAYYVHTDQAGADGPGSGELKAYLTQSLPQYMVPPYFMKLKALPLTGSGKVDRKALPEVKKDGGLAAGTVTPPRDGLETRLVEIWSGQLGIEKKRIGIDTNFFTIGGHSLKATLLAAKIHKDFKVRLQLTVIFNNPTIRALAGYIKETTLDRFENIQPAEEKDHYALSSAQKRIYVLQQLEEKGSGY
ncbi:MAG: hypothetical protein GY757_60620, partial [bacterium]|nr:hypothetical protein [bacterium]